MIDTTKYVELYANAIRRGLIAYIDCFEGRGEHKEILARLLTRLPDARWRANLISELANLATRYSIGDIARAARVLNKLEKSQTFRPRVFARLQTT